MRVLIWKHQHTWKCFLIFGKPQQINCQLQNAPAQHCCCLNNARFMPIKSNFKSSCPSIAYSSGWIWRFIHRAIHYSDIIPNIGHFTGRRISKISFPQPYTEEGRIFPSCSKNTHKKLPYASASYVSLIKICPTGYSQTTCLHAHPLQEPESSLRTSTRLPQVSARFIHKPVQEVPKWQSQ